MKKLCIIVLAAAVCLGGCQKKEVEVRPGNEGQETLATDSPKSTGQEFKAEDSKEESVYKNTQDMDYSEASQEFKAHFNEITVNGNLFTLPCSYEEMESHGFQVMFTNADVAAAGTTISANATLDGDEGSYYGVEYAFKGGETSRKIEDCDAVSFQWASSANGGGDILFYGGINGGSTREEVAALLPQSQANPDKYAILLDDIGYTGLEVIFNGEEVSMIHLSNYADYIE